MENCDTPAQASHTRWQLFPFAAVAIISFTKRSGLGYPTIKAGRVFELLSDVPDVMLSILHGLPHLILIMAL